MYYYCHLCVSDVVISVARILSSRDTLLWGALPTPEMAAVIKPHEQGSGQKIKTIDTFFVKNVFLGILHRLLKLRADGGQSRVRELGSIDFVM